MRGKTSSHRIRADKIRINNIMPVLSYAHYRYKAFTPTNAMTIMY